MGVEFRNFEYSFINPKGKPVFVPSAKGEQIGDEVRGLIRDRIEFEPYYFHFSKGAHVAALHLHRANTYFARIDLKNFFYSVGRNRVKQALKQIGVPYAEHYAKWSSVRNPYDEPRYSLPYGFPQSPVLATLTLRLSALGMAIHNLPPSILRSVYLDDIAISGNDLAALTEAFEQLLAAVTAANFAINEEKTCGPAEHIDLFNCGLTQGRTEVLDQRIAAFDRDEPSDESRIAFERYCETVAAGNA